MRAEADRCGYVPWLGAEEVSVSGQALKKCWSVLALNKCKSKLSQTEGA